MIQAVPTPTTGPLMMEVPVWLQFAADAGTVVAAIAAIVAAGAALKQSRRSTEAARDALEALGRVLQPGPLSVGAWQGNAEPGDLRTPEQWPGVLRLRLTNSGSATAENVVVHVIDATGRQWPQLGPTTLPGDRWEELHLAGFIPTCRAPDPTDPSTDVRPTARHRIVIHFSDGRELLRWKQEFSVIETAILRLEVDPPVPQRLFTVEGVVKPELLNRPR